MNDTHGLPLVETPHSQSNNFPLAAQHHHGIPSYPWLFTPQSRNVSIIKDNSTPGGFMAIPCFNKPGASATSFEEAAMQIPLVKKQETGVSPRRSLFSHKREAEH